MLQVVSSEVVCRDVAYGLLKAIFGCSTTAPPEQLDTHVTP